jgi:hypothetical protein
MTKKIIFGLAMVLSLSGFAQQAGGEFDTGANAQDAQTGAAQTDAAFLAHVNKELDTKCDSNGCTIASKTQQKKGWTVSFNIGNGSSNGGTGTTINLGNGTSQSSNQNYYGVSLTYTNMKCTTNFKIQDDNFINFIGRAYAQRNNGSAADMKPLSADAKFVELLQLEIYKQLGQNGCL